MVANQDKVELLAGLERQNVHQSTQLTRECDHTLHPLMVSDDVVAKHLRSGSIRNAPGPGATSPFLLMYCAEELTGPLTRII